MPDDTCRLMVRGSLADRTVHFGWALKRRGFLSAAKILTTLDIYSR